MNIYVSMNGVILGFIRGFGNILLPIMLGISDLIFPWLNAMPIRLFIFSPFIIFIAITIDNGTNCGFNTHWTSYFYSFIFIQISLIPTMFIDYFIISY